MEFALRITPSADCCSHFRTPLEAHTSHSWVAAVQRGSSMMSQLVDELDGMQASGATIDQREAKLKAATSDLKQLLAAVTAGAPQLQPAAGSSLQPIAGPSSQPPAGTSPQPVAGPPLQPAPGASFQPAAGPPVQPSSQPIAPATAPSATATATSLQVARSI